ncbi:acyltransferase [Phenylobacterium sp.]|uniref:acyltransferase n=1 Tax=Phenylobacterium sp. TaxID=1871053 RepID=UPI00286C6A19|nr:acyltransferase [Phenylobacterium sp.]
MPLEKVAPGSVLELESEPGGRVVVNGTNCTLRVGKNVRLDAAVLIYKEAANAVIEIGDDCVIDGIIRIVRGDGGVIRIGAQTTFNQVGVSMHEAGTITFGRDCMLSTDIHMDVSDMHPIFDRSTGERLNPAQDITLGDHVWLSTRVLVLKGARIGSGTIVGAGSMVSGALPQNVLAVGSPARVVRENVVWTRTMDGQPDLHPPPA